MSWDDLKRAKTMRVLNTSKEIRARPTRMSQQVFRTRELVYPVDERPIAIAMQQEKRRFVRQDAALARTKKKVEQVRAKLYAVGEKNRRLSQLRYQLQKERWAKSSGVGPEAPAPQKALKPRVKEVRIRKGV